MARSYSNNSCMMCVHVTCITCIQSANNVLLLSKQAGLVISTGYYVGIVTYRILDTHAYVELHVK